MKAAQGIYNWQDTIVGTTVPAQAFQVTENGGTPAASLVSATAIFSKDGATTITATVTITDATLWKMTVAKITKAQTIAAGIGIHQFELHTVDSNGVDDAYLAGTLPIIAHV